MSKKDSKKGKNSESTPPPATDAVTETAVETPSEVVHEKLSIRSLFADYSAADAELERTKRDHDLAAHSRSMAVKRIFEFAKSKGPFRIGDQWLTIVERTVKGKTPDDPETKVWFFKGNRSDAIVVE